MIINLTKIPSFWLTCDKTASRWPRMEEILKQLEIPAQKVNGRLSNPYTLAVAESHLQCLKSTPGPVLIIEDDVEIMPGYRDIVEVPDDTAALYIGTSQYGINFRETRLGGVVCKEEGDHLRIFNMLSMHAILYLSEDYKNHVIGLLESFKPGLGVDQMIAEEMCNWKVLAVKSPMFYQNDGWSREATETPLHPIF